MVGGMRFVFSLAMILVACGKREIESTANVEIDSDLVKNFQPSPVAMESAKGPLTEARIALGRRLYYEPLLSKAGNISCNSCHPLDRYGVDGEAVSTGHGGQKGSRNAPTTYHAAGQALQFWDGRAPDVEEQAKGPVLNPLEMAMASASEVERVLAGTPGYPEAFAKAFPGEAKPVTFDNAAISIASFERKLVTRGRWDRFLEGDSAALTQQEKAGFIAFHNAGCAQCHNGPHLGGKFYVKVGMAKPWPNQKDLGRFLVTRQEHQKMVFKVPVLRNVEKTAPYFHDGSVASLEQAVGMMAEHQTEKPLTDREIRDVVAWLKTLTGEIPADYIRPPAAQLN